MSRANVGPNKGGFMSNLPDGVTDKMIDDQFREGMYENVCYRCKGCFRTNDMWGEFCPDCGGEE